MVHGLAEDASPYNGQYKYLNDATGAPRQGYARIG